MHGTEAAGAIAGSSAAELRLQRNLKIVVIVLALLLAAGLATGIGRIIYLASAPGAQQIGRGSVPAELSMQLPAGAEVRAISVAGDRLAVHYVAAGREGISVVDLRSGKPAASVAIERRAPVN